VVIGLIVWERPDQASAGIDQCLVPLPAHPDQLVSKGKSRGMLEKYGGGLLVVE